MSERGQVWNVTLFVQILKWRSQPRVGNRYRAVKRAAKKYVIDFKASCGTWMSYKTVKIVKLTSGSFNSFIMIDGGRVVRVDAYIGTFLIKTARGALLCVLTPGLRRQFALCICTHCGCIWDANVLYLCIAGTVFVLYLYCICVMCIVFRQQYALSERPVNCATMNVMLQLRNFAAAPFWVQSLKFRFNLELKRFTGARPGWS